MAERKSEEIILHGKTKFCRPYQADDYGKFSMLLYFKPESLEKFKYLGVKTVLKKDDDGYYARISCPVQKLIKGRMVGMPPIQVIDKEGKPFHDPIGDGSTVAVKVVYYKYTSPLGEKGAAIRWTGLKVMEHIPFVPVDHFKEDEKAQIGSLQDLPATVEEGW
jgi:hypothetical protein